MSYTNIDPKSIDEKRRNKEGHKIKGCMSQRIFEYVPNSKTVYNSEYLCECKEPIELDETVEQVNVEGNTEIEEENGCELDEDTDQANRIYEFTAIPSFVAVIIFSLNEPMCIIEVTEKRRATQIISDM